MDITEKVFHILNYMDIISGIVSDGLKGLREEFLMYRF